MIEFLNRFAASMTDAELDYASSAIYKEQEKRRRLNRARYGSSLPGLTEDEQNLVNTGLFVDAIKAYRIRIGCTLKEAKDEVEAFRDSRR